MNARAVSREEADLLRAILGADPAGDAVSSGLAAVRARDGCECGCGSVEFIYEDPVDEAGPSRAVYPVAAEILDDDDAVVGGVILFVRGDRLDYLDVHSYGDGPLPVPRIDKVRVVHR